MGRYAGVYADRTFTDSYITVIINWRADGEVDRLYENRADNQIGPA